MLVSGDRFRGMWHSPIFKQAINILLLDLLIPPRRYFSEQSRLYLYILLFSTFPIGALCLGQTNMLSWGFATKGVCVRGGIIYTKG